MTPLKLIVTPFLIVLLTPFIGLGQSASVCEVDNFGVSPIEANWRTFAPSNRFENPHYIIPPVLDYVTLEDGLFSARDAVTSIVLMVQLSGKGGSMDAYIDNYIRVSLSTAFYLLVAYEWGVGPCMDDVIQSLMRMAQEWLPNDPHKRIGDASPFYDNFNPKYNEAAALEAQRLCEKAVKEQDPDSIFAALKSAVGAAVVAITSDPSEAKRFVEGLSPYAEHCDGTGICLPGVPPPLVGFEGIVSYNETLPRTLRRISFSEATENRQLFPLTPNQVEQGLAYYFQSLHEDGDGGFAPSSFGSRILDAAWDSSHMKKTTSAVANTGKFVAGYMLSCRGSSDGKGSGVGEKSPIELLSQGSKNSWIMGFTLLNRMTALVSAVNKLMDSFHEYQHAAPGDLDSLMPSVEILDSSLRDIEWELQNIREAIAKAAASNRSFDAVMLVDAFEEAQRNYDLLISRKRLAEEYALAASLGLEDAGLRVHNAAWSLGVDFSGSVDALMRFSSSVMKSSLKLAVYFERMTKDSADILKNGLPDAFEKLSPMIGGALSASSLWFDIHDAMGMVSIQSAAKAALLAASEADLEFQAALHLAEGQDWVNWGAYFIFDILKTTRNFIAAALSWGVVEFAAHSMGGHSEIAIARSVIAIWSLTLINAVIPTYWKWTEDTANGGKQLEKQSIFRGIRDALSGGGESDLYLHLRSETIKALQAEGNIADEGVINSMIVSQLLYQLIDKDSRYAAYILLYRYRDGDPHAEDFFQKLGFSSDQLEGLRHAPAELWLRFVGESNSLRPQLEGLEARSINFVENRLSK